MRLRSLAVAFALAAATPALAPSDAPAAGPEKESKRGWLGVELEKNGKTVSARHVVRGSPAALGGMQDGDVIVSIEGAAVAETSDVVAKVALAGPGGTVKVKVKRGSTEKEILAKLVGFPGFDAILKMDKVGTFAPTWTRTTPAKGSTTPLLDAAAGSVPKDLTAVRGKVLLIDFWEAACGPCLMMAPTLSKWHSSYGAQGLEVLGVTTDDVSTASQAATKHKMSYPIGSDGNADLRKAYGVKATPTVFLVDKKGVIRDVFIGFDTGQNALIEKQIKVLLAEAGPADAKAK